MNDDYAERLTVALNAHTEALNANTQAMQELSFQIDVAELGRLADILEGHSFDKDGF